MGADPHAVSAGCQDEGVESGAMEELTQLIRQHPGGVEGFWRVMR